MGHRIDVDIKVKSLINPEHTAIIQAVKECVQDERFPMLDFVNGLVIKTGFWGGTSYTVKRVTCPKCGKVHVDPKINDGGTYWPDYLKCPCDARLEFVWHKDELNVEIYQLIIPYGYELAE